MLGGGVDAATLVAALGAGPPPPECRWAFTETEERGVDTVRCIRYNNIHMRKLSLAKPPIQSEVECDVRRNFLPSAIKHAVVVFTFTDCL